MVKSISVVHTFDSIQKKAMLAVIVTYEKNITES